MGLLQTWEQYSTYVDSGGKYRVIWKMPDNSIRMHKFDTVVSNTFMERFFDDGGIARLVNFEDEDEKTIADAIAFIRPRPALTLTQWNAYLNALTYEKRAIIKAFIHKLAIGLAKHYGVTLSNYTETEILAKTRNWICSVELSLLKRVCFGYLITI